MHHGAPLLRMRSLRSIAIQYLLTHYTFTCAPDALLPFTQAWPNLEHLCVHFYSSRGGCRPAFATTLVAFAENCPRLRRVQLPCMDCEDDAMDRVKSYASARNTIHGLQELRVWSMASDSIGLIWWELALLVFPGAVFVVDVASLACPPTASSM